MAQPEEDKQLARLYDYTKFHIGIYLSFAGGIAALLGSQNASWFLSDLVAPNSKTLYAALGLMVLAGACGGIVASSTIECQSFRQFWEGPQGPQSFPWFAMPGRYWAMFEHLYFWLSLFTLAYAVAIGFPKIKCVEPRDNAARTSTLSRCVDAASAPKSAK